MILRLSGKKLSSFQTIILGFWMLIVVGTLLLMLPIAVRDGHGASFEDALFTSTSAVCVTGLVVKDTASYWSGFGQAVILLLLAASTGLSLIFTILGFSEANIITAFILEVLIIAAFTVSPIYSIVSSLASVLLFNWFFVEPLLSFQTYEPEYVVTFIIMLISSLMTWLKPRCSMLTKTPPIIRSSLSQAGMS